MTKLQKIFFACAIGAGIGTMFSLELQPEFCWIGFLTGGFVGYISYEFKNVLSGIGQAFQEVKSIMPAKNNWKASMGLMATGITIAIYPLSLYAVGFFFWNWADGGRDAFGIILPGSVMVVTILVAGGALLGLESDGKGNDRLGGEFNDADVEEIKWAWINLLPPVAAFKLLCLFGLIGRILWINKGALSIKNIWRYCIRPVYRLIYMIVETVVMIVIIIALIIWKTFVLIHSDERILVGTDAMLGSIVGYFFGSVLVGIWAGGLIGVLSYKFITELILMKLGFVKVPVKE